jgi:hypothetical protein
MRSSWLITGLMALAVGGAEAQQARSILFIGNSFTFGSGSAVRYWRAGTVTDLNGDGIGGVPALFKSFADQMGLAWDVYLETRGGTAFDFHLQEKRAEITSRAWDVVVAHSYSTLDRDAPNDPTDLLTTGRELSDVLHERSPSVELYVTATWSRPDLTYPEDTPWHGKAIDVMGSDVDRAYDRLAAEVAGVKAVNPVGEAFNRAIRTGVADGNPYDGIDADKVDLWTFDHYHASSYGYYLHALVVFGNVTGVDPAALGRGECSGHELGISADQVEALQQVARDELVAAGVRLAVPAGWTPPERGAVCEAAS